MLGTCPLWVACELNAPRFYDMLGTCPLWVACELDAPRLLGE